MQLEIAGLIANIFSSAFLSERDKYDQFRIISNEDSQYFVHLIPTDNIQKPQGNIRFDGFNNWLLNDKINHDAIFFKCSRRDPENELIYKVDVEDNWRKSSITFLSDNKNVEEEVALLIGYIIFKNRIIFHQGLIFHAAAISWNGKGILFTAPSGTGKSTQADLWVKRKNAVILNDDSPAVRLFDDQAIVFGTPWCGSRGIFKNAQAPLSAIIVLDQSDTNSIEPLTTAESIPLLLPRCFLPYHDSALMDIACTNLANIITRTPVYHLRCRPNKDAVEIVAKCINSSP